jgi:hypothetical protein
VESDQEDEDVDEMLLHGGASSALLAADDSVNSKAPAAVNGGAGSGAALLRASTNISQYSIQRVPALGSGDNSQAFNRHQDFQPEIGTTHDDDDDYNEADEEGDADCVDVDDGDNAVHEPPPPPVRESVEWTKHVDSLAVYPPNLSIALTCLVHPGCITLVLPLFSSLLTNLFYSFTLSYFLSVCLSLSPSSTS